MACAGRYVGVRNLHVHIPSTKIFHRHFSPRRLFVKKMHFNPLVCAAGPESTTSTLKDSKPEAEAKVESSFVKPVKDLSTVEKAPTEVKENATSDKPSPPKAKVAAAKKAPLKPLPEMMTEDVIPAVKAILEKETDISHIELVFEDNKLEGSFTKKEIPYSFWVFFLDGTVQGLKAFSLSSYGSPPSTFEPFLTIERKPTSALIIFGIHKRLYAQRILPENLEQTK